MDNEQLKFKMEHTTLTLAPPKIEYLGINLIKHTQDLYDEKYQRKLKEVWIFHVHW